MKNGEKMRIYAGLLINFCLICSFCAPEDQGDINKFNWPGGARAAICFTYDDGLDVHLDNAMPDLEAAGFRGTFYVQGSSKCLYERMNEWRAAAARGHELGNHTLFHPCVQFQPDGRIYDWLTPERALENYTVPRIIAELTVANTLLKAVDGKSVRTLAYTCCDTLAGGESFVDRCRSLFIAARGGGDIIVEDMRTLDLYMVPSRGTGGSSKEMIEFAQRAAMAGTMAVFMFHGVGGGHNINVSREAHQELIAYIKNNPDKFWVGTFAEAAAHVCTERKRLGWDNRR